MKNKILVTNLKNKQESIDLEEVLITIHCNEKDLVLDTPRKILMEVMTIKTKDGWSFSLQEMSDAIIFLNSNSEQIIKKVKERKR